MITKEDLETARMRLEYLYLKREQHRLSPDEYINKIKHEFEILEVKLPVTKEEMEDLYDKSIGI